MWCAQHQHRTAHSLLIQVSAKPNPKRLSTHAVKCAARQDRMSSSGAVWLSASRKFIALHTLDNIVGFEYGRCYGAGMIRAEVAHALPWPPLSMLEDQKLYERVREHADFQHRIIEADDLLYVHRRHETNASAPTRAEGAAGLWKGVMPLQLGGGEAMAAAANVRALVAAASASEDLYVTDAPSSDACDDAHADARADASRVQPWNRRRTMLCATAIALLVVALAALR